MSKSVYKYDAPIEDDLTIEMPAGAQVLCVQMHGDRPCVWALVNRRAKLEPRLFHWRGTGHDAGGVGAYVGTVQALGGRLVFHLFEAAR